MYSSNMPLKNAKGSQSWTKNDCWEPYRWAGKEKSGQQIEDNVRSVHKKRGFFYMLCLYFPLQVYFKACVKNDI